MFRKLLLFFLIANLGWPAKLPRTLTESQKSFILQIAPKVFVANQQILEIRTKTIQIQTEFLKIGELTKPQSEIIATLAKEYNIKFFKQSDISDTSILNEVLRSLIQRIDKIPPKLVIAQAIIESGWGKSYFAKEANNYFGVHCYKKGCGLPPKNAPNANFEVKKYADIESCIADYMQILNSVPAYKQMRESRMQMRQKGEEIKAEKLADALTAYSQKGEDYVKLINNVIHDFMPGDLHSLLKSLEK